MKLYWRLKVNDRWTWKAADVFDAQVDHFKVRREHQPLTPLEDL